MLRFVPSRWIVAFAFALMTGALVGCDMWGRADYHRSGDTGETIVIRGTVQYMQLEGGFWAIEGADETTYEPLNLPEAFQEHGIAVQVQATIRDDMGSIYQVGPIIEIRSIERR